MKNLYRIIDANINRAMEGIRVIEDIVRFELDEKAITSTLKNLRSDLKKTIGLMGISRSDLLEARESSKDVGADMYSEGEAKRTDIGEIITSNFKRIEEALRILEESAKLLNSACGKKFKALRYRVYDLEKELMVKGIRYEVLGEKLDFDLYVIVDPEFSSGRSPETIAKEAIKGGAKIIQLRDKKASKTGFLCEAKKIAGICRRRAVTFIVNDHVDIAKAVDADGVHLGQDDVPISVARKILGEDKIIGVSASTLREAESGERAGADYIGFGPVFRTDIKAKKPAGLSLLKKAAKAAKVPIVAIGGIDLSNIYNVRKTGVKRAAVIRAAGEAKDIRSMVRRLKRCL